MSPNNATYVDGIPVAIKGSGENYGLYAVFELDYSAFHTFRVCNCHQLNAIGK